MKNSNAPSIDDVTSNVLRSRGQIVKQEKTTLFKQIIQTQKISIEWKEANMIILHEKKAKILRPIKLLPDLYNIQSIHEKITHKNGTDTKRKSTKGTSRL